MLKNVFEFQHLLGQNGPSMEVQQSSSKRSVEVLVDFCPTEVLYRMSRSKETSSRLNEMLHHTKTRGIRLIFQSNIIQPRGLLQVLFERNRNCSFLFRLLVRIQLFPLYKPNKDGLSVIFQPVIIRI
jgi:hypothetical protein